MPKPWQQLGLTFALSFNAFIRDIVPRVTGGDPTLARVEGPTVGVFQGTVCVPCLPLPCLAVIALEQCHDAVLYGLCMALSAQDYLKGKIIAWCLDHDPPYCVNAEYAYGGTVDPDAKGTMYSIRARVASRDDEVDRFRLMYHGVGGNFDAARRRSLVKRRMRTARAGALAGAGQGAGAGARQEGGGRKPKLRCCIM